METGELQFRKSIGDFSRAIEQGRAAVYRRNFESRTYEYIGRYIKELTGYDQTELTPELWDSLILHTEQKGELQHLELAEANRLVRSGQVERWQADVQIRTRSGETRWVTDMSTVLRDAEGTCFGCLGVLQDITERKAGEQRLARLSEELRRRNAQMEADLAMAREVQQALIRSMPREFPRGAAPGTPRLHFSKRYLPAEMLAGDFMEILPIGGHEVGVFIGDVMGHGVRAALLTTFLRGLMEELVPVVSDPGRLLTKMNRSFHSVFGQGDDLIFATAIYLVIDVKTGVTRFANAGHTKLLHLRPGAGDAGSRLSMPGRGSQPALGIVEDFQFTSAELSLGEGESLLLYTDGVLEAGDADEQQYGRQRMLGYLQQHLQAGPDQLLDGLIDDVRCFTHSEAFEDDVCLLAITRS
ncbi:SpoIIE family protein phosphatase [Luteolibacter arcticus]|uniref:SpoIIE family protein phosphatase n=1 Tax=Luteolibacter arcticus TaxID=1581411 RepID=A0ABT3GJH3_9BACT|nr:SpoIIE family protein phosphatase [Luteolibacter arcticus]MCW1923678.1 SpoIIE family protein phosphatase [Luteolibacter arcticus]